MSSINLMTHEWANERSFSSHYFPEISSTNEVAKLQFPNLGKNFAVYLTDHQSEGRGRDGTHWDNLGHGETLLSTWCFRSKLSPQPILTPLLGLSLYNAVRFLKSGLPLRLKPPNDLVLAKGKLSGILVEVIQQGRDCFLFVGLGMNVFASPQVDQPTSSLSDFVSVSTENWKAFCDQLHTGFQQALIDGVVTELQKENQTMLLNAINAGLGDSEKYLKINAKGDLFKGSEVISWMDL